MSAQDDYPAAIERVVKVIAGVLADNREVNGGELESVLSIYTPEGIAILCRNALAAEGLTRLIRLGEAVERQRPMTLTSYSEGWNRCLDRIYHDAGTDPA